MRLPEIIIKFFVLYWLKKPKSTFGKLQINFITISNLKIFNFKLKNLIF